jgi:hypothetical protein
LKNINHEACILHFYPASYYIFPSLNFFMNVILICYFSQTFELCHVFKGSCLAFWVSDMNIYFIFSAFTSRPSCLLASNRACVLWYLCLCPINYHHHHRPIAGVSHSVLILPELKAKFKSSGDRTFPFFMHQTNFYLCRLYFV